MTEDTIRAAIFEGLRQIAPESDPAALAPGEDIRQTLEIDSFDFLNLLIRLHERLGVEIPESDYGKVNTVENMVSYIAGRTAIEGEKEKG